MFGKNLCKKLYTKELITIMLVFIIMLLTTMPAFAQPLSGPANYQITVTSDGGRYEFDKIELIFKKNYLGKDADPITFDVSFYAENGIPYIQIEPSVGIFEKPVIIKVNNGKMNFYDTVTGETLNIKLKHKKMEVEHFSRYIVIDF